MVSDLPLDAVSTTFPRACTLGIHHPYSFQPLLSCSKEHLESILLPCQSFGWGRSRKYIHNDYIRVGSVQVFQRPNEYDDRRTAPAAALRREGVPNEALVHRVRCIEWLVQGPTASSMVSGGSIRYNRTRPTFWEPIDVF